MGRVRDYLRLLMGRTLPVEWLEALEGGVTDTVGQGDPLPP